MKRWLIASFTATFLSGCHLFNPADLEVSVQVPHTFYPDVDLYPGKIAEMELWWRKFEEGPIGELIEIALVNSNDIESARQNVRAAMFYNGATIEEVEQFERDPDNSPIPLKRWSETDSDHKASEVETAKAKIMKSADPTQYYFRFLNTKFEIDLFNRAKYYLKHTQQDVLSKQERLVFVQKTVRAQVVKTAVNYFYLKERKQYLLKALDVQRKLDAQVKHRYDAGLQIPVDIYDSRDYLTDILEMLSLVENSLNIAIGTMQRLTGLNDYKYIESILDQVLRLPNLEKDLVLGTPLSLISKRPDVLEKERALKSAAFYWGYRYANLFPRLDFKSEIETMAEKIRDILKPGSLSYLVEPILKQNAYNRWKWHGESNQSMADYEIAKRSYLQTITTALTEVNDSISTYIFNNRRMQYFDEKSEKAEWVAKQSYKIYSTEGDHSIKGRPGIYFIQYVESTFDVTEHYNAHLEAHGARSMALIELIRSLGY